MEFKVLVVLAVLGVASGFTIPDESSFASSYTDNNPSSAPVAPLPEEGSTRGKRHLMFKKYKKGKGEYEHGTVGYDTNPPREVHYHHYDRQPQQPSYVEHRWEPRPAPPRPIQPEYHHYHGHNEGSYAHQGSGYYQGGYGGYYSRPGYGQYGPQESGPVGAAPVGQSHNNVDRGQGAAAVNNIAIIHARAGSSSHQHEAGPPSGEDSKPIDFEQFSREVMGMD